MSYPLIAQSVTVTGMLLMAIWGVLSIAWKRDDISWAEFMISGPLMFIRPAKYTRADRVRVMRAITVLAFVFFAGGWLMLWSINNL